MSAPAARRLGRRVAVRRLRPLLVGPAATGARLVERRRPKLLRSATRLVPRDERTEVAAEGGASVPSIGGVTDDAARWLFNGELPADMVPFPTHAPPESPPEQRSPQPVGARLARAPERKVPRGRIEEGPAPPPRPPAEPPPDEGPAHDAPSAAARRPAPVRLARVPLAAADGPAPPKASRPKQARAKPAPTPTRASAAKTAQGKTARAAQRKAASPPQRKAVSPSRAGSGRAAQRKADTAKQRRAPAPSGPVPPARIVLRRAAEAPEEPPLSAERAVRIAARSGGVYREEGGLASVTFPSATPSQPAPAQLARSVAAEPSRAAELDLDDVYEQVASRLRRDLLADRERVGDLTGALHGAGPPR